MQTVVMSIGQDDTVSQLVPYIDELIQNEDDETNFAIAEELGKVF